MFLRMEVFKLKLITSVTRGRVLFSSTSSQIFLFKYCLLYKTYNLLWENNYTTNYCWRRPQNHNTLTSNRPNESTVAATAPSWN